MTDAGQFESKAADAAAEVGVLARGAGISMLSKFGARGMQLAAQILVARLLGPMDFGLFTIGQSVFQMSTQFGSLGLPIGVIRYGVPALKESPERLGKVLRHVLFLGYLSGLTVGGGVAVLAPWIATIVFKQPELVGVLRAFALASTIFIWLNVTRAATLATKQMQYSALSLDLVPSLITLILLVTLIYELGLSLPGAILSVIAGFAVGWGLSIYFTDHLYDLRKALGPLSFRTVRDLLAFSLPNMFAGIFVLWLTNVTILFLGYFVSPDQVGIFQAAEQIAMLSGIVLFAFQTIVSPMVVELFVNRELERINEIFKISTKWGLYLSLPPLLVMAFMPAQIMTVIYGKPYANGAPILVGLMLAQLVNTATGAVATILGVTHHQNRLMLYTGVALAVCALLNLWLVPKWGIVGAAVALAGTIASLNLALLGDVRRLLGLWPYDRRYFKFMVAVIITTPLVYWVAHRWIEPSLPVLVGITLVSTFVFGSILYALGLERDERRLLLSLKRRLLQNE